MIQIQLQPEIEAQLAAEAQARGLTPESYVEKLIADRVTRELQAFGSARELSLDEFNASLDALTRYSDKIPSLPIEAFSRESFYENHD